MQKVVFLEVRSEGGCEELLLKDCRERVPPNRLAEFTVNIPSHVAFLMFTRDETRSRQDSQCTNSFSNDVKHSDRCAARDPFWF